MQEVACTRSKVKLGCDICDHLEEVINQLMDLPHKSNNLSKEAHAADDEGHTADFTVVQEASCTRSKVKLGCDICDHLEEVINQLLDLPHKSNNLSKEAEALDNDLYNADLPIGQEESSSASKDRIMCETVSKLEKAIEEMDNLECEHDNLNKEAHAADDEGHTTDIPVVQEAPCIRHKVELSRDIYGSLEERIPRLMGLPFKSNEVSKEAEDLVNIFNTPEMPAVQEESFSASKDRIMCEAASNLEKAVEEFNKLESEHDSLNKKVGSSFHSYYHCLIGLVVTFSPLDLRLKLRDV
ncbi:uncharacterized protein LOC111867603 [Cryptotermes secundus]|uniref:uncharacterized protein LOC111867603 n=1 Tax=Cryptotermes secundus TaxID=105785 RepID=UPI001454BCE7|nr:uncharacterized protein LOC111867603 [Cryptotermes secundus]